MTDKSICALLYKQFHDYIQNEIQDNNSKIYQEIQNYERDYEKFNQSDFKNINRAVHLVKDGNIIHDEKINSLIDELDKKKCCICDLNQFLSSSSINKKYKINVKRGVTSFDNSDKKIPYTVIYISKE